MHMGFMQIRDTIKQLEGKYGKREQFLNEKRDDSRNGDHHHIRFVCVNAGVRKGTGTTTILEITGENKIICQSLLTFINSR